MGKRIDLTGQRFGRLVVLPGDAPRTNDGHRRVRCQCDCGNEMVCDPRMLREGDTQSCGCLHKERVGAASSLRTTHGMTRTAEYNSWRKLKRRCLNPEDEKYPDYGGRGIKVCDEWLDDFDAFFAHMGSKPHPSYTVERIDVDGDYEPGNCRWASPLEQARNKRHHRFVRMHGRKMPLSEACEALGINYRSALYRLNRGLSIHPDVASNGE